MSMNTYDIYEPAGFLIDKSIAPYILLHADRKDNCVPENVQKLLDENVFDDAVRAAVKSANLETLTEREQELAELIPDDYMDIGFAVKHMIDIDHDCIYANEADVEIQTYESADVPDPICTRIRDNILGYLQPLKRMSYTNAAYASVDELVDEYRNRMEEILPADFDYRRHICSIEGTYFC